MTTHTVKEIAPQLGVSTSTESRPAEPETATFKVGDWVTYQGPKKRRLNGWSFRVTAISDGGTLYLAEDVWGIRLVARPKWVTPEL
jgi:hypothetical protein